MKNLKVPDWMALLSEYNLKGTLDERAKIKYSPKEGFKGRFRCPEYGHTFKVSRLEFFKEAT